jgi:glycerophosphoryl diester phosphodiesterase
MCAAAALAIPRCAQAQPVALEHAHAHNDYLHPRPLLDALERGFRSIEADVHLVNGQLLVAHNKDSVDATRTLESLYLDPLRAYVQQHGGRAYRGTAPLILLIDVKSDADATYPVLNAVLRRYADLFTIYTNDELVKGPVLAIVSGNRAIGAMRKAGVRFAGVDGRLSDLSDTTRSTRRLMPLISDSWDKITKWKGVGPAPDSVARNVAGIVARAHKNGHLVRFWGTPDNETVWRVLRDAGVDLIGADDLDALRNFLK